MRARARAAAPRSARRADVEGLLYLAMAGAGTLAVVAGATLLGLGLVLAGAAGLVAPPGRGRPRPGGYRAPLALALLASALALIAPVALGLAGS